MESTTTTPRPIYTIAREIRADWQHVNYAAQPYLRAMFDCDDINSSYGDDNARSIVAYFLCNAASWRGPVAKRIKSELKGMLKTRR